METKYCSKCEKEKTLLDFHKKSKSKDGVAAICKECHKYYRRQHYLKNKSKVLKQVTYYNNKHKEKHKNINSSKKSGRIYKSNCKNCGGDVFISKKDLNNGIKRCCSRKCSNYLKRRPFKYHENNIRKSALKRNKKYSLPDGYIKTLFEKQGGLCAITSVPIKVYSGRQKSNLIDAASLDRKDSSLGYTEDNVQWVNLGINYMKRNFNEKCLHELLKQIVKNYKI